jgi:DNA replication regulator SLD3
MPPTLTRSATVSAVPGLKREADECSPWTVPAKDSQPPMNVCRGGVLKSKRFSQREIDMSFTTIATNVESAKSQRRSRVEEELKEAITTLKRPNRGLAIKEFVETAERRVLAGSNLKSE